MKSVNLIKLRKLVRKSNKVPGVLYEWAATDEIKAALGGAWTSVFFLSNVLFGSLFDNIKASGHGVLWPLWDQIHFPNPSGLRWKCFP